MGTRPAWRKSGRSILRGTSAITGKGSYQSKKDDNNLHLLPSQHLWTSLSLLLSFQAETFHHKEKMKRFHLNLCNPVQHTNTLKHVLGLISSQCLYFLSLLRSWSPPRTFHLCLRSKKRGGESELGKNGPGVTMSGALLIQLSSCSCSFFSCVFFPALHQPWKLWVRVTPLSGIWFKSVTNKQWKRMGN